MGKRKAGQASITPQPLAAGMGESGTIVSIELETPMTTWRANGCAIRPTPQNPKPWLAFRPASFTTFS